MNQSDERCELCRHWTELGSDNGICELARTKNKEVLANAVPLKKTKYGDTLDFNGEAVLVTNRDFLCSSFDAQ